MRFDEYGGILCNPDGVCLSKTGIDKSNLKALDGSADAIVDAYGNAGLSGCTFSRRDDLPTGSDNYGWQYKVANHDSKLIFGRYSAR